MNLNFISSDVLLPFDKSKHFGLFVYLMNEDNGYQIGLYFGGIDGWERLTNDIIASKFNIDAPVASDINYYYNGITQTYYPKNWESIKDYCSIDKNEAINAGTYQVGVALNDTDRYQWSDNGLSGKKTLSWIINKYPLTVDNFSVNLIHDEITYGGNNNVTSVICNHVFNTSGEVETKTLTKDVDYVVVEPTSWNCGRKEYTINFIGSFAKNYNCPTLSKSFSIIQKSVDVPTNLKQSITFDGSEHNPLPSNWSNIESLCEIVSFTDGQVAKEVGVYKYYIKLKDKENYKWSDDTTEDKTLEFEITNKEKESVELPNWTNVQNTFVYSPNANYEETPIDIVPENWTSIMDKCNINIDTVIGVGEYNVTVSLKDTENYKWSDNTSTDKTFKFTITPFVVDVPTQNDDLMFNNSYQYWYPKNWDSIIDYCEITNNYKKIVTTTNASKISLKSPNYKWSDNTTEDKILKWKILPVTDVTPTLEPGSTDLTKVSDGSYTMTYNEDGNIPSVKVVDNYNNLVLTEDTHYTVTYPENYNEGSKTYTITMKGNYSGSFTISLEVVFAGKKDGYFISGPTIVCNSLDGEMRIGCTMSVVGEPVDNGEIIGYKWYYGTDDNQITSDRSGGELDHTDSSFVLQYPDEYWRVEVEVAETDKYLSHVGYATAGPVKKNLIDFKFLSNSDTVMFSSDKYTLPGTTKPSDDNATVIYSSSDNDIAIVDNNGRVTMKSVGTVTITAIISGSNEYEYRKTSDTFTLNIVEEVSAPCYWGYTPFWDYIAYPRKPELERLQETLASGELPSNKINAVITDNNGINTFKVSADEYVSLSEQDSETYHIPCWIWWFAIPYESNLTSVFENSTYNITVNMVAFIVNNEHIDENSSNPDEPYKVTVNGVDYKVYAMMTSKGAFASSVFRNHNLIISYK